MAYRAEPATCNACLVKAACTESTQGRSVHRSLYAEYLDPVRAYHQTAAHQEAVGKRKVWVEPLFGEAKDWHGPRRFRVRGLEGERRGAADRDWPEPEATAPEAALATPTVAKRGFGGSVGAPDAADRVALVPIFHLRIASTRPRPITTISARSSERGFSTGCTGMGPYRSRRGSRRRRMVS